MSEVLKRLHRAASASCRESFPGLEREAIAEIERLEAIVAKLPRDKEGNLFKRYGVIGDPEPATPFALTES